MPDGACSSGRGPHVHGDVDPRAAHRPRAGARPLVPPLAPRRAERHRRGAADRGVRPALDASGARSGRATRRVAVGAHLAGRSVSARASSAGRRRHRPHLGARRRRHSAWISCAGKPPWTLPDDQREDDARSLVHDWAPLEDELELLGHPRLRLTVASSPPVAFLSARLCDVFPDGTSALVSRGVLNLTHRDGHAAPSRSSPASPTQVELELEATSWVFEAGHRVRLALAGSDWPNTWPPPHAGSLAVARSDRRARAPGARGAAGRRRRPCSRPLRRRACPRRRRGGRAARRHAPDRPRRASGGRRASSPGTGRATTGRSARRSRSVTTAWSASPRAIPDAPGRALARATTSRGRRPPSRPRPT